MIDINLNVTQGDSVDHLQLFYICMFTEFFKIVIQIYLFFFFLEFY